MSLHVVLLLAACVTCSHACSTYEPWLDPHLPRNLQPNRYHLHFRPYMADMRFKGYVGIEMRVLEQTNFIIVHAKSLNISTAEVKVVILVSRNVTTELNIIRKFAYVNNSYWVVETEEPMLVDDWIYVTMYYWGNLGILTGLVKKDVTDVKTGISSSMVLTVFKPNHAREAFPNFDEPYFKSKFTLEIDFPLNYSMVSNMPPRHVYEVHDEWQSIIFAQTPPINSFAVGLVISKLVSRNNTLPDGKLHNVWARPEKVQRVEYGLAVTSDIQNSLILELGRITELPKIDQIATPFILSPKGQAHWGLIYQDEARLTFNSTVFGDEYRQKVLTLVATELAHNYFGLLVTCRYWNHVWLHAGLARFYGLKAAASIESISHEEVELRELALHGDAFNYSRPLVVLESNITEEPDVAHRVFYRLFSKGAAVLKMTENFLGVDEFKSGIRQYIARHSFKTVVTQDLFNALQEFACENTNVTEILSPWVYSMGFPVINVEVLSDRRINATQKRFLMDPLANPNYPPATHGYKWHVPLNYRTISRPCSGVWMNKTDAVFHNLMNDSDNWIIFNTDQSGYYRVNYERTLWNNIAEQLKNDHEEFSHEERSQLLSDALNIASAEQLGFDVALNLTLYASNERCISVWTHIYNALKNINLMLANTSDFTRYQKYVLNLTNNVTNEMKVVDEGTTEQKMLRPKILSLSCAAGHRGCIENTTRLFETWIQNNKLDDIPVNIRPLVVCHGIANSANEREWNITFTRFLAQRELNSEREVLLLGIACTKNLSLLLRYIESCLSNNTERKVWFTDLQYAVKEASARPQAGDFLWQWLKSKRAEIIARFNASAIAELAQEITFNLNTEPQLQEVSQFFDGLISDERVELAKTLTKKRIEANIRWMRVQLPIVSRWLRENFSA